MNNSALVGMRLLERMPALLEYRAEDRDIEWLTHALQSAVSVEFSTVPPYLCALWSIKDQMHPVAAAIRSVVHEEMLHMSLACNMLTAIGAVPQINNPLMVPRYPGPIPGKVHPELTISLSGLTDESLDVFIAIEEPTFDAPDIPVPPDSFNTIGAFYEAIRGAFNTLAPKISPDRQVSGPLANMVLENLDAVNAAITLIVHQGEGSTATPTVAHDTELAHYYRFREVRTMRRCSGLDEKGEGVFDGAPLERPETWPMSPVPLGGYVRDDVPSDVWNLIDRCDQTFTRLLDQLQAVWADGDQASFIHAIETMFALSEQARLLMRREIGADQGNYGPCFRYLS